MLAFRFNTLAKDAEFTTLDTNHEAIRLYLKGLREDLLRDLVRTKTYTKLSEWQAEALCIDNLKQGLQRLISGTRFRNTKTRDPDAMDVDAIDTRPQRFGGQQVRPNLEDARRTGKCFNCGGQGHLARNCPSPKRNTQKPGTQGRPSNQQWRGGNQGQ